MTALPLQVQCCIKETACTITRNCSLPLSSFPAKKLRKLNRCSMDMYYECTMTALPNSMLHQRAHTTITRQERELGPHWRMKEHIQLDTDPHPGLQLVSYNTKERVVAKQYKYSPQSSLCSAVPLTSQT